MDGIAARDWAASNPDKDSREYCHEVPPTLYCLWPQMTDLQRMRSTELSENCGGRVKYSSGDLATVTRAYLQQWLRWCTGGAWTVWMGPVHGLFGADYGLREVYRRILLLFHGEDVVGIWPLLFVVRKRHFCQILCACTRPNNAPQTYPPPPVQLEPVLTGASSI